MQANYDDIVMISVVGEVRAPPMNRSPFRVGADGSVLVAPGPGGVVYNVRVGDRALGWAADHVEPGASIQNADEAANGALNTLACVGNEARVVSGEAKGKTGTVTGKHGGIEHVLVDFDDETLDALIPGDKVLVKAYGRGLKLLDHPTVKLLNVSVQLLRALPLSTDDDGALVVPVVGSAPAHLMGSGLGSPADRGDYDIQTADRETFDALGLAQLRLGDLVALPDADHSYGRGYRKGALTIAVVAHCDSISAGHGPGVTSLLTSATGAIRLRTDPEANIASYLKLRA